MPSRCQKKAGRWSARATNRARRRVAVAAPGAGAHCVRRPGSRRRSREAAGATPSAPWIWARAGACPSPTRATFCVWVRSTARCVLRLRRRRLRSAGPSLCRARATPSAGGSARRTDQARAPGTAAQAPFPPLPRRGDRRRLRSGQLPGARLVLLICVVRGAATSWPSARRPSGASWDRTWTSTWPGSWWLRSGLPPSAPPRRSPRRHLAVRHGRYRARRTAGSGFRARGRLRAGGRYSQGLSRRASVPGTSSPSMRTRRPACWSF